MDFPNVLITSLHKGKGDVEAFDFEFLNTSK